VNNFLENLKDPNSPINEYLANSFDLYSQTIKDFIEPDPIERLVLIPDDILSYIPFEALSVHSVSPGSYQSIPYLIKNYSVSYAASLSVLDLQNKRSSNTHKKAFLGMASDYAEQENAGLSRLTFAVEELNAINQLVQGDVFLNKEASKDHFLDIHRHYRNIHLSLHGFVNTDNPSFSYLQFPATLAKKSNEGKLYSSEIYNRVFDPEMLVLSACETGTGTLTRGEGILSLAHAFAYAGTKSTVLSLWQLSSQSTAEIMKNFYGRLESSHPQDQALQLAKLNYLAETKAPELAHPFYWAAMIQYGNANVLNFQQSLPVWIFPTVVILIFFLCYWIFFRRSLASSK
jgi:CHAT domain-containing protein